MKEKEIELKAIRIGLLGDMCVGKTCICNTFTDIYKEDKPTIGTGRFKKKIELENGKEMN